MDSIKNTRFQTISDIVNNLCDDTIGKYNLESWPITEEEHLEALKLVIKKEITQKSLPLYVSSFEAFQVENVYDIELPYLQSMAFDIISEHLFSK